MRAPLFFLRRTFPALIVLICCVATAFAQRPLGIDVSDNDGTAIDWGAVKNSGISFAWAKATEGLTLNDGSFAGNEARARAAGVLIGAYHYAHPETHVGLAGADSEAAHFWTIASNYIGSAGVYLMPMLDFEQTVTNVSPAYTAATLSAWANEWCQVVQNFAASNGVTIQPVIYTFVSYANGKGGFGPGFDTSLTNRPLWMAQYPGNPDPQTSAPSGTSPWASQNWSFWQYSSTLPVDGISGTFHDHDVYNGVSSNLGTFVIGGLDRPFIISQSITSRVIDAGSNVTFTANAGGSGLLTYQWALNGTNIPSETNTSIQVNNAQPTNNGIYILTVSNNAGTTATSPLSLTVFPLQALVFADDFDSNTAANWAVNRSSTDTAVAFNYDYSALGIPSAPNSVNGTTSGVQLKANLTKTAVAALSISPIGQSFAGDYRLHFDAWINVNGPLPGGGASSTEFLSAGIGTAGNRAEWTGSGSTADGFYFTADGDGGVSSTSTTFGDYAGYIGTAWQNTASGIYAAGSEDNANTYYQTVFPVGQAPPNTQKVSFTQQTGSLSTGTFGLAWHDVIVARTGNIVKWAVNGVLMATITNANFTASNVFVGFWDPFSSLTDNTNLSFGLVDNVRVEVAAIKPEISQQPVALSLRTGDTVMFQVTASGMPAPSYQWFTNSVPINGATAAIYQHANAQASDVANYSVVVSNVAGSVVSSNALLTMIPTQPAQFGGIVSQLDHSLQITAVGQPYATYIIETSTNLSDWTLLTNLVATNGQMVFNADPPTNDVQRYFRARSGP